MRSFMTRLISGAVLLAIILYTGIVGGAVLFAFTLLISLIGLREYQKVFHLEKDLLGILGLICSVVYYAGVYFDVHSAVGPMLFIGYLMALMAVYVFTFPKYRIEQIVAAYCAFIW